MNIYMKSKQMVKEQSESEIIVRDNSIKRSIHKRLSDEAKEKARMNKLKIKIRRPPPL